MVIWGTVWGAILGLFIARDGEFGAIVGAVFGALAGFTLRRAVRTAVQQALAQARVPARTAVAEPAPAPAVEVPEPPVASRPAPAAAEPSAEPASLPPRFPSTVPTPSAAPEAETPRAPSPLDALWAQAQAWLFGGNTVVRAGVLVLFVGLAFLARYAVENALFPPELRLAAIAAAGIALFGGGWRLRRRGPERLGYALSLQGAGVAVLYLTVFAAFRLYQFLPAGAAFVLLGLICAFSAVIALAQNAQALAFIGFAGGFAAPILASTGQGSHVALFSYYLLLGIAIAAIAWARAWRPLNLLGFFATFGIATAWGVLRWQPDHYATTQPFLAGFFAVYLAATLAYALRHGQTARRAVDATLVFGLPIATLGLQVALVRAFPYGAAFSSLALGAVYLALTATLLRGSRQDDTRRWLAESFAAIGLGFVTLAVPLALDGRWTAAVWAVEGAAVFWMGRRQNRWLARAAGLVLQVLGALLYLESLDGAAQGSVPLANPGFLGAALLAAAALAIAWWASRPRAGNDTAAPGSWQRGFLDLEAALAPVLLWIGFLWAQVAFNVEISRQVFDAAGQGTPLFGTAERASLRMVAWIACAFELQRRARSARAAPWPVAATPAWTTLPVMLGVALWGMARLDHVFQGGGWLAWPVVLALHARMLRQLDAGRPAAWWPWVHAGGVWLLVLLAGNLLVFAIGRAQLWQTAWATVILLVAGSLVLLALARQRIFEAAAGATARWPLDRFAGAYLWRAAAPVAVALALGALVVAVESDGNAHPLPYVPLLNPTDLAVALALGVTALWLVRLRRSTLPVADRVRGKAAPAVLAGITFVAINTVWLRIAHHYADVPWYAHRLFGSFLVQAGYSILWTLMALGLMVVANRRGLRAPWMLGAGLLGLTLLKLFVIDLSNRGGTERIVVFIAVGLLMLVVGWLAPLPPAERRSADERLAGANG